MMVLVPNDCKNVQFVLGFQIKVYIDTLNGLQ